MRFNTVAVLNPDLALYYSKYIGKDLHVEYIQSNTNIHIYIYIIVVFDCVYSTHKSLPLYKKHNGDDAHQNTQNNLVLVVVVYPYSHSFIQYSRDPPKWI